MTCCPFDARSQPLAEVMVPTKSNLAEHNDQAISVCFMIDQLSRAGTEVQLLQLLELLRGTKVTPSLVLLDGTTAESQALEPHGLPILRLGVKKLISRSSITAARRLRVFWREHRPDVLQVYFLDSAYFGVPLAKLSGIPRVVRVRNNLGYWLTPKHRLFERCLLPWVDAVLTNSAAGREALQRQGTPPNKIRLVENQLDLSRFTAALTPSAAPFARPGRVHIGTVANLRPVKNLDGFLYAAHTVAKLYPHVRFSVAGDGPERAALLKLRDELGLADRFEFLGSIADIPAYLATLDVFVLPSHSEGRSNAILEAMASGRAIVATDVGANGELLQRGQFGVLIPAGNLPMLANAMIEMIEAPSEACQRAAQARQAIANTFAQAGPVKPYLAILKHITS